MLLPLMLRTLIEGSSLQGRTSQRELEHVRRGVDGTSRLSNSSALAAPSDEPHAQGAGGAGSSSSASANNNNANSSSSNSRTRASSVAARLGTQTEQDEDGDADGERDDDRSRRHHNELPSSQEQELQRRQSRAQQQRESSQPPPSQRPNSPAPGEGRGTSDGRSGRGVIKIGFFLHTPFPSSEIYRILPVRREILLGILHSDLIGFHTYDYARHFLSACTRILGLPTMPNGAEFEGRYVHVGAYPIGIEPSQFVDGLRKESVRERIRALERRFEGVKIIVGVDRLDYIKGVPQKLLGLETFLQEHPEWIGKVS